MTRRGTAPCLIGPAVEWRFEDLDRRSARFAAVLLGTGAAAGDVVLCAVEKSADSIALYLACLRAGLVHLPVNPAYTPREMAFIAADAQPRVMVCAPALADRREAVTAAVTGVTVLTLGSAGDGTLAEGADASAPRRDVVSRSEDEVAALLYTSGTTGRPKGVPLTERNLLSNGLTLVDAWGFTSRDVLLHALPLFHVHGLFVALHCALLSGAGLRLLPRFDAGAVRRALHGSTVMMGVPTFYSRLLALPDFGRDDCAGVRLFVSGSAPLPEKLFHAFEARTGHRVLERYGMTETNMIASNPLHGERIPGTVGHALPGVSVRVTGDAGTLPAGEAGMLEVTGPNVFAGYRNRPEADAEAFTADGWFVTGDLARMAPDGRITLVGRARDLIISGGFNVYAVEVETCLDQCEGVRESAVVGVPDDDLGEKVVAVVVPADPDRPPEAAALQAVLARRLARYKQPRRILLRSELPRNTMGKVQKQLLREECARILAGG